MGKQKHTPHPTSSPSFYHITHNQSFRQTIFDIARQITPNIAYFVPRNTDPQQLARLAGPGGVCEIEKNYLKGRFKAITAYYGYLQNDISTSQCT